MPSLTIEERVSALEKKVAHLLDEPDQATGKSPWWEQWFAAFRNNPDFDEAMHRGAEFRKSQPNAADDPDAVEF